MVVENEKENIENDEDNSLNELNPDTTAPTLQVEDAPEELKKSSREKSWIKPLRTYKSDVAAAIRHQGTSMTRIILAEKKKQAESGVPQKTRPKSSRIVALILSFLLLITGAIVVSYIYLIEGDKPERGTFVIVGDVIFTEKKKEIFLAQGSRQEIIQKSAEEIRGVSLPLNQIEEITFKREERIIIPGISGGPEEVITEEKTLSSEDFFTVIESRAPSAFIRSLNEKFIFGVHAFTENNPFLIFTTESFAYAFSGMLAWEEVLLSELTNFFALKKTSARERGGFKDEIIENQDVRVLRDKEGKIVLLYAFPNQETLIITTHEVTLDELLERLKRPKKILR